MSERLEQHHGDAEHELGEQHDRSLAQGQPYPSDGEIADTHQRDDQRDRARPEAADISHTPTPANPTKIIGSAITASARDDT